MKKVFALFLGVLLLGGLMATGASAFDYNYRVKVVESTFEAVNVYTNLTAAQAQTYLDGYYGTPLESASNKFTKFLSSFTIYTDSSGIASATKTTTGYSVTTTKRGYSVANYNLSTAAGTYAVAIVRLVN